MTLNLPHMPNGDLVKALGYNTVFLQLTNSHYFYELHRGYDEKLRSMLTQEQVSQADTVTQQLLAYILSNGELYRIGQ